MAPQAGYAIAFPTSVVIEAECEVLTGHRMDEDASTNSLGDFDKFPAEVRNHIYKLALTSPSPILMKRSKGNSRAPRTASALKLCGTATIMKGKQKRRFACAIIIGLALIRVSKVIYTEAAPIFYSTNSFVFTHLESLNKFLCSIKEMAFFLTDLEINMPTYGSTYNLSLTLRKLRITSEPKHIAFGTAWIPTPRHRFDAIASARDTWFEIADFVKREGEVLCLREEAAAFISHVYTSRAAGLVTLSLPTLTEDEELKRLRAFDLQVPSHLRFPAGESGVKDEIADVNERTRRFTQILEEVWREDLRKRKQDSGEGASA